MVNESYTSDFGFSVCVFGFLVNAKWREDIRPSERHVGAYDISSAVRSFSRGYQCSGPGPTNFIILGGEKICGGAVICLHGFMVGGFAGG